MRDLAGHQFGRLLVLHQPPRRVDRPTRLGVSVYVWQPDRGARGQSARAGQGRRQVVWLPAGGVPPTLRRAAAGHTTIQRTAFRRQPGPARAKALVAAVRPVPEAGETA